MRAAWAISSSATPSRRCIWDASSSVEDGVLGQPGRRTFGCPAAALHEHHHERHDGHDQGASASTPDADWSASSIDCIGGVPNGLVDRSAGIRTPPRCYPSRPYRPIGDPWRADGTGGHRARGQAHPWRPADLGVSSGTGARQEEPASTSSQRPGAQPPAAIPGAAPGQRPRRRHRPHGRCRRHERQPWRPPDRGPAAWPATSAVTSR